MLLHIEAANKGPSDGPNGEVIQEMLRALYRTTYITLACIIIHAALVEASQERLKPLESKRSTIARQGRRVANSGALLTGRFIREGMNLAKAEQEAPNEGPRRWQHSVPTRSATDG